jgi:hypothetical protein
MPIPDPQQGIRVAGQTGHMSPEFWLFLLSLITYIRELEARIEALEP